VHEAYLHAISVLRDVSTKAPGAKNGLLVMGVANAGKTRLAFEAVRKALPTWHVFIWRVDDTVPPPQTFERKQVVIFIDDLQDHAPSEVRYARGATQTLDTRPQALQKMVLDIRGWARSVVLVATCRVEDELRTHARLGWLFAELSLVTVPLFPLKGPEAETIIGEFREQALQRIRDWDGTIGSLVLGLSARRQSYAELVIERDPAARVLQAMKLLTLADIEQHTEERLRAVCVRVFARADLERDDLWRDTVDALIRMQFVTEGQDHDVLVIRKDAYFDQVITDYPAPDRPLQLQRDLEKAVQVLADQQDAEAVFHLGNTLYSMKLYPPALDAYEKVLALDTFSATVTEPIVWRNKGAVLQSLRRLDDALAAYDQALALDPAFASAWRNRGDILQERGSYDAALDAYDHALASDAHNTAALNSKGRLLSRMGRGTEALAALEQALSIDPGYDFAWRVKGDVLQRLKRSDEALGAYDRALELNPGYAYAWNGKGVVYRETGRAAQALAAFDKAIELDPQLFYAWTGRGATLRDLGKYNEALAALDRALTLNPDYPVAQKNRGTVLEKLERYDEALQAYDRALALDPSYAAAHYGRGMVLAAQHQYDEALTAFDRALSGNPGYLDALLGKAWVLEQQGRRDLAAQVRAQAEAAASEGRSDEQPESAEEQRDREQMGR
jgi:tetratricopeptide (TPR) repeat protein